MKVLGGISCRWRKIDMRFMRILCGAAAALAGTLVGGMPANAAYQVYSDYNGAVIAGTSDVANSVATFDWSGTTTGQYTFVAKYTAEGHQIWLKTFEYRTVKK